MTSFYSLLRLLLAAAMLFGLAQPIGATQNSVSLWNKMSTKCPDALSFLCKHYLFGGQTKTVTEYTTKTSQPVQKFTVTDTVTQAKIASLTSTSYTTTTQIVTTVTTNGVTFTTTIP